VRSLAFGRSELYHWTCPEHQRRMLYGVTKAVRLTVFRPQIEWPPNLRKEDGLMASHQEKVKQIIVEQLGVE